MSNQREVLIRQQLEAALNPVSLEIIDDSHHHAGHGAKGGHYTVQIVAEAFQGKSMIQRHRLVYDALQALMENEIHALSIHAKTPGE